MASEPRPLIGFAAGIAAGLIASAALAALAAEASRTIDQPGEGEAGALPPAPAERSGNGFRYVAGAVLGGIYGLLAEYRTEARDDFDSAYGVATGALMEAAGPGDPEESAPPRIFGPMLLGIRALIAGRG